VFGVGPLRITADHAATPFTASGAGLARPSAFVGPHPLSVTCNSAPAAGLVPAEESSKREGPSDRPVEGLTSLAQATNDLVREILQTNPYLKVVEDSMRRDRIDAAPALSLVLAGRSPVTGVEQRVTLYTRELADDHVVYALFIAPGEDYADLRSLFDRMASSLRVNDEVAHR